MHARTTLSCVPGRVRRLSTSFRSRAKAGHPKIDIHGLESSRATFRGVRQMTAGDVREKRAERSCRRRRQSVAAKKLGGGETAREQTDRGRFHIAFDARDLAREAQAPIGCQPQSLVE